MQHQLIIQHVNMFSLLNVISVIMILLPYIYMLSLTYLIKRNATTVNNLICDCVFIDECPSHAYDVITVYFQVITNLA